MSALGTEARIDVEWQARTLQGYVGSKPENPNSGARAESVVWLSETLQADPGPQSLPKPLSGCERRKIVGSCTRWRGFNQIYTHTHIYKLGWRTHSCRTTLEAKLCNRPAENSGRFSGLELARTRKGVQVMTIARKTLGVGRC